MREALATWISGTDALRRFNRFGVAQVPIALGPYQTRSDDYYLALVGELFERIREPYENRSDWARLGNAIAQYSAPERRQEVEAAGIDVGQANLYAASAFYFGGFPASAYLIMSSRPLETDDAVYRACFELLGRPQEIRSEIGNTLVNALRSGNLAAIDEIGTVLRQEVSTALRVGPSEWIPRRLLHALVARFRVTNIRAVLPDGASDFWTPLVESWLAYRPPAWDFFPSQIEAIEKGILQKPETFSLQMPTGAGKTALCETLLYWHTKRYPAQAGVLLVPYRSLASELRRSFVRRLNGMGIPTGCAYGGTVPSGDEVRGLDDINAMVATPETLSGLLSANPTFSRRVSLLICDEGHLLDGGSRGVSLELLLARMKAREGGSPRFVFVSAIVPNIEEINSWLGGNEESVVRSDYRPALAEFSVLRSTGEGASSPVDLDMHPHEAAPIRYTIEGFLSRSEFQWINPASGRRNTYAFNSVKTRAVAAARKALPMGAAVVFAANKRGNQGAVGLAEELLDQLQHPLMLPSPIEFAIRQDLNPASEYLRSEYGADWIGTRALEAGAVLHHGDIPQETREVVETLIRQRIVQLAICTSTLAEGVNLPIRTLVLYSVRRRGRTGLPEDLLMRDIKNLVGRAGRAGATTKGLVICSNAGQWALVEPAAKQAAGERVVGALRTLVTTVRHALAVQNIALTNQVLEATSDLYTLIDGIDATLIDLASAEIGEQQLVDIAIRIADQTFAAQQADAESKRVLQRVFELRARRVSGLRNGGRLAWVQQTGTRARLLDSVEIDLLPSSGRWDFADQIDPELVRLMFDWAWGQRDLQGALREAYRLSDGVDIGTIRQSFSSAVTSWLSGNNFVTIAAQARLSVDDAIRLHSGAISFVFQTIIEQGVALLQKMLEAREYVVGAGVLALPDHLRFGVPTRAGRLLAAGGVRHRRAAVELGGSSELSLYGPDQHRMLFSTARRLLVADRAGWEVRLGSLVMRNTIADVNSALA